MANFLTIRGFACSGVELRNTQTGFVVGNFRMGSTHRRQDPVNNAWSDGDTNWFRVNVFRSLAQNSASSIHKGDRIIVVGRLHLVTYLRKDGSPGISVEIDAESIGPDLQFGSALYSRTGSQRVSADSSHDSADQHQQGDGPDPDPDSVTDTLPDDDDSGDQDFDTDQRGVVVVDGESVDTGTGELNKEPVPF
ncbi:single-stranded DNA-binding protein [Arthrobacter cryoconiti]|uniref:Single-stranded DNA-binding protein n=1 Tax=Arthrobacter cryoconiti TaxID=748907 RepID=A0ABV8R182_9MICC|nr:single-stranded DNA-binding protein [Arthrobacter cryoconiti]MCC9068562.1 single-stranded DNA-binding protein [Arthrobacter cryoconiti]